LDRADGRARLAVAGAQQQGNVAQLAGAAGLMSLIGAAACGDPAMSMMAVDAPKLDCPKGLVPVWVDKAAGTGECTVVLPSAEAAKT